MRIKTQISIALFVMLFLSVQTAPAFDDAVACYYSDKLKAGDEFTWATNLLIEEEPYPGYLDFWEYEYGIENDSTVTLQVLQNPEGINFHWESFNISEYGNYFNLTIGENNLSIHESDDLFFWFIIYTKMDFINGTTINPTENSWAYFVVDDYYFQREESSVDISIQGDVVTYDCLLEYDVDESIAFNGQIDKSTGLMINFRVDVSYYELVYSVIFEIQDYTPQTISWPFSLLPLILITVPIILIRRRK